MRNYLLFSHATLAPATMVAAHADSGQYMQLIDSCYTSVFMLALLLRHGDLPSVQAALDSYDCDVSAAAMEEAYAEFVHRAKTTPLPSTDVESGELRALCVATWALIHSPGAATLSDNYLLSLLKREVDALMGAPDSP